MLALGEEQALLELEEEQVLLALGDVQELLVWELEKVMEMLVLG